MFLDLLSDPVASQLTADLCIIGCGPAGLAIAKEFLGTQTRVCIIESGGLEVRQEDQLLTRGTNVAMDAQLETARVRVYGGTGSVWGGGCMPFRSHHVQGRSWIPGSDWPLPPAELESYTPRASEFFEIPHHRFSEGGSDVPPQREMQRLPDRDLENHVVPCTPINFGVRDRGTFASSENITVLLHANVLELVTQSGDRVDEAVVASLAGHRTRVRAQHFVLASGGIENARLLMVSGLPKANPESAAYVGRCLMEHPIVPIGELTGSQVQKLCWLFYGTDRSNGATFPKITLRAVAEAREGIMAGRVHSFIDPDATSRAWSSARRVAGRVRRSLRNRSASGGLREKLTASSVSAFTASAKHSFSLRHSLEVVSGVPRKVLENAIVRRPLAYEKARSKLVGYFEQAPDPSNRITLSTSKKDALGLPEVETHWRLTEYDVHSIRSGSKILGTQLAEAASATFHPAAWLDDNDAPPPARGAAHHMGTTRMSAKPADGVVDANCAVHGMKNLHVAGSSVFTSGGGWAFPTFTIVALAIRLADRLQVLLTV